jgi:hypothetical protein
MKFFILFLLVVIQTTTFAQTHQAIPYQAVARNAAGVPLSNQNIKVRFSIRDSILSGTIVYRETHTAATNALGLFNLNVGLGTPVTGTFSGINWGKNAKFLQVEMDPAGGNSFVDLGTQQMMSVPYALYSENSGPKGTTKGDLLFWDGGKWSILKPGKPEQYLQIGDSGLPQWKYRIGQEFGGGIIFYLDSTGEHGLVVTKSSIGKYNWISSSSAPVIATSTAIGSGLSNTQLIVSTFGPQNNAANACLNLVLNGFDDWYLPSVDELNYTFKNGLFPSSVTTIYWSSSDKEPALPHVRFEYCPTSCGVSGPWTKSTLLEVLAIRSF